MGTGKEKADLHLSSANRDDDLLPLSALQHLIFCERQCALIHIERLWEDNPLTIEGSHLHHRVDETLPRREVRGDTVILRGLALRSLNLGLVGRADVVEFHRCDAGVGEAGGESLAKAIRLHGVPGYWMPFPVEYKLGKPKPDRCDEVQLCAQALCLEEMLAVDVPEGALFYGRVKRRQPVLLDRSLRDLTRATAERLHGLLETGMTPRAQLERKCKNCSLMELCLPEVPATGRPVERYLHRQVDAVFKEEGER